MTVLGYVVIEYNQASKWPELHTPYLCDDESHALTVMETAREVTSEAGRRETFSIAQVIEVDA